MKTFRPSLGEAACIAFTLAWPATVWLGPYCEASAWRSMPLQGLAQVWALVLCAAVFCMQAVGFMLRGFGGRTGRKVGVFAGLLLLAGILGCALAAGCEPLEAWWPTWPADRKFPPLTSHWKVAGNAGMFLGVLGLIIFWANRKPPAVGR